MTQFSNHTTEQARAGHAQPGQKPNKQQALLLLMKGIQSDLAHYRQLHQLMYEQQRSYLHFDGEQLLQLTQQQQPLIDRLQSSAAERHALLGQLGVPQNQAGMQALLNALPDKVKRPMQTYWQQLASQVQACQKLNHSNGRLSASFRELLKDVGQGQSYETDRLMT
ncbi:flagellar export chaperone FlgN [Photobacterium sp. MCCC 1A19761]|uniref:flagellar export chaperone FlgN n=1 Tax=Photobacterium sp. MCCC 1A19761 TaxID=3115000 RepID=UPI00307E2D54